MGPILEAVERRGRDQRDAEALWSRPEGRRLTFGDLAASVERWRRHLDLPAGRPVGLATGNTLSFPSLFFALLAEDVPVVALDAGCCPRERGRLCRSLGVSTLFEHQRHGGGMEGGELLEEGVLRRDLDGVEPLELPAGTALVKLTSGSTGEPLGICLDEAAMVAGIEQIAEGMEIGEGDRVLISIPLSHSYGFDNGVLSLAIAGTPLIVEGSYYPTALLRALDEGEVTFFPAVPPMVRALAEVEWPEGLALRRVICAGGPLAPEFAQRFLERSRRPVHQFYGSTETGGVAFERHPQEPGAAGTVGHPLPGVDIQIGGDGTVVVDSAANYIGNLGGGRRKDRRVSLGDEAAWTPCGRLRLQGRKADLLNVGGKRVSAGAIEAALLGLDGVREAAVVGVADPLRGDRVVAFVVADTGELDLSPLPRGLLPREVRRLEELPHTERGKLDRRRLRGWAALPKEAWRSDRREAGA